MAIPRQKRHIVLDMAVSKYAYETLGKYEMENKELPYPGDLNTFLIGKKEKEHAISQLFLVFDMEEKIEEERIEETVDSIHSAERVDPKQKPSYPGERTYLRRQKNLEKGIAVKEEVWEKINRL